MKITDIEAIILRSPFDYGMEDDAGDSHGPKYSFILKVHTDEGITGLADIDSHPHIMAALMDAPVLIDFFSRGLKEVLIGENPLETDRLWWKMYNVGFYHGRRGALIHLLSGLDIAFWDIKAKALGVPVSMALGARNHVKITAYASTLVRGTPYQMKQAVSKYRSMGYKAVKFGWGAFTADPERGVALFQAAREEAGQAMTIMCDGYITQNDIRFAARIIRQLEELNVFWVEEPLPSDNLAGFRQLAALVNTRIATGEQLGTRFEYEQLIDEGNPDVVQFDISRCGGLSEARQIVTMAEMAGKCFCPHAWTSDILTAASLHLNAWARNPLFQEFCVNDSPTCRDLCLDPIKLNADGTLDVPSAPGLGVELNEEVISKYRIN
jgi:L-rhamnonate dehydratase